MATLAFTVFGPETGLYLSFRDRREALTYAVGHRGTLRLPGGSPERSACTGLLERIFADGNGMGPGPGFTVGRRSLSVGDVVTLEGLGVWFCDAFGWIEITEPEAGRFPLAGRDVCPPLDAR